MRTATATLIAVLSLLAPLEGQNARRESASSPRTPWGQPVLQGRWTSATLTPLQRPTELGSKEFFTESEAADYAKIAEHDLQQQFRVRTDTAGDPDSHRTRRRLSNHRARWPTPSSGCDPLLAGQFPRPLGRRHPGPLDHVEVGAGAAKFAPTDEFPSRSRDEPGRCKDRVAGT